MATCKNCTHYKMCAINIQREDVPCKEFKDQELVLYLPCKVGDTVYKICPISPVLSGGQTDCDRCTWKTHSCYNIGYRKGQKHIVHPIKIESLEHLIQLKKYIGKIYFLSQTETEQKIKELDENGGKC